MEQKENNTNVPLKECLPKSGETPYKGLEILAPAGDEDMLRAAVFSGADCVYLGIEGFNARRSAANFSSKNLSEAVAFCHARNCKVYAALNTLVFTHQESEAMLAIKQVANAGCDAVIVQDLGLASLVKEMVPTMPLHASTQMSVHSVKGAQKLEEMGFSRVVLGRELTENEIEEIAQKTNIELEVFVHGALCVSVSGQCYLSAFLGGRSANKGGCAGPCRLPFEASLEKKGLCSKEKSYHLSLKDLSILHSLPKLAKCGVVSAKIEGRLRGAEYCAVAVDSALKARENKVFDEKLLSEVFSRSGFTDGWYTGENGKDMFGVRTSEDSAKTKKALPKAKEIYRRERPRVSVCMNLTLCETGLCLWLSDGENEICFEEKMPLSKAENSPKEVLAKALSKTGGTPFFAKDENISVATNGFFVQNAIVNGLRKKALEKLLHLRESNDKFKHEICLVKKNKQPEEKHVFAKPKLRAYFEMLESMPKQAEALCEEIILPLRYAEKVPEHLRNKTRLSLPRASFGAQEKQVEKLVQKTKSMGFLGYELQNIAHFKICENTHKSLSAGFGLNLANGHSAKVAKENGCDIITLSLELTFVQMRKIIENAGRGVKFDALCYGFLPMMLTRACPLKNVTTCKECKKQGVLIDRKGENLKIFCENEVRSIHNPVPLWTADKFCEMPTDFATLYFTSETKQEAAAVLQSFAEEKACETRFTRGLYEKGVDEAKST